MIFFISQNLNILKTYFILFFISFFSFSSTVLANGKDISIDIISDKLLVDYENNIATFMGNIKVIKDDIELTSVKVNVYYKDNKMVKIHALGNVRVYKKNENITTISDEAILNILNNEIKFIGHVKIIHSKT